MLCADGMFGGFSPLSRVYPDFSSGYSHVRADWLQWPVHGCQPSSDWRNGSSISWPKSDFTCHGWNR